jgi:hypothetical protein
MDVSIQDKHTHCHELDELQVPLAALEHLEVLVLLPVDLGEGLDDSLDLLELLGQPHLLEDLPQSHVYLHILEREEGEEH